MALATKCPQCGALFRVVADQLKLRGGLVRCGQCRAVFDAIGSLTYVDEVALAQSRTVTALTRPASPPPPPPQASVTSASRQALGPATTLRIAPTAPATLAGIVTPRVNAAPSVEERPAVMRRGRGGREAGHQESATTDAGVPTLMAPQVARPTAGVPSVEGIEVIELPPPPPDDSEPAAGEGDEPDFIRSTRRADPRGFDRLQRRRVAAAAADAGTARGDLPRRAADAVAQARLTLVDLCAVHRTVNWLTGGSAAVIGSELQAVPEPTCRTHRRRS
jgi:predicted Zn finger-like uncharacterized protein